MHPRVTPKTIRAAERREREASAPRLAGEVPTLRSLDIQFDEQVSATAPAVSYVRRVVIPSASSHFEVGCGDSGCIDGGHDLTSMILRPLRDKRTEFSGEDACHGSIGSAQCQRVLRFSAVARYSEEAQ